MKLPTQRNILVVDDAVTVRMYHRKILGDAGWQTAEACNGLEAMEAVLAADRPFDLFVVDVNMPRMDGYAFVRELRRLPVDRQAPVVMVSSEAKAQDASAGFDAGVNCYLVKPSRPHELVVSAALLLGDRAAAEKACAHLAGAEA